MEVKQIYDIVNAVTGEVLGKTDVVAEDLSNIVDVGTEILNATDVDNYVRSLVDHIGKVVFVNRAYAGGVPSVLMDGWEYGSILEKITVDTLPDAVENDSWKLTDGQEYNPNIFHAPKVSAKFFNKRVTFEVEMSFTERQVKESFSSAAQLNGFISMIYNAVDKSMTIKIDGLVMRTINNMIGETLVSEYPDADYTTKTGVRAVNLLKMYNDKFGTTLTAAAAVTNPEFIRFASMEMGLYIDRMAKISTLFNVGGKDRFTSADMLHVVMLSEFKQAANSYLQSDTYNEQYTALPNAETVPYWQGSGKNYDFSATSKINITTASGKTVNAGGILAVMFDRDACGVTNLDRRVTTAFNAKGEFYNCFFKFLCGHFNDMNENAVVFFVA